MTNRIDFVITWVNENDEKWQEKKFLYQKKDDKKMNDASRYRDWDILRYWFRSVEKYAPWVNKIFFVTEGHIPDWLNLDNEKLLVVKHSDFIEKKYLPTFNSNVIELSLPNIKELSDQFVCFNDDMFLNDFVQEEDFFYKGLPRDMGIFSPIVPIKNTIDSIIMNNVEIINNYFCKKIILRKNFFKFFNFKYGKHMVKTIATSPWNNILGFYDDHIPISYKKDIFEKVVSLEKDRVTRTKNNKFRTSNDISHWLVRYWQICEGSFIPRSYSFGKYYNLGTNNEILLDDIENSKHKVICMNDNESLKDFIGTKKSLLEMLDFKYKGKSKYEL